MPLTYIKLQSSKAGTPQGWDPDIAKYSAIGISMGGPAE